MSNLEEGYRKWKHEQHRINSKLIPEAKERLEELLSRDSCANVHRESMETVFKALYKLQEDDVWLGVEWVLKYIEDHDDSEIWMAWAHQEALKEEQGEGGSNE